MLNDQEYLRCVHNVAQFFLEADEPRTLSDVNAENKLIAQAALMEYIHGQKWVQ